MDNNQAQRRVHGFLEQLARDTRVFKGKARLELARKINERSRIISKKRKQRERMRQLAKELQTSEAQLQLTESDISRLEATVEEGTDGEDN